MNHSKKRTRGIIFNFIIVFIVIAFINCKKSQEPDIENSTWSIGIFDGKTPFDLNPPKKDMNPVQCHLDLPDGAASLVAHPRMFIKDSKYYLFYTAVNKNTDKKYKIGMAESANEYDWEFKKIILDTSYNMGHPFVFEHENKIYMIPEPSKATAAQLYIAEDFPNKWKYEKDLITRENLNSVFVFRHDNTWWMIHSQKGNDTMFLHYADDLYGPWKEHPQSPVIVDNKQNARPAGSPFLYEGNLYRLSINCVPRYGTSVFVFKIDELTRTSFKETRLEKPLIKAGKTGWNCIGMHHADVHQMGDNHWIAAVDAWGIIDKK
jgi:hypothetical protein